MIQTELAWAAGLFDGEGCTSLYSKRRSIQVSISQKYDRFVLDRFKAAVGGGYIYWPESQSGYYRISGVPALLVLQQLWPYLSPPKKEQALRKINEANHYLINQLLETKVVALDISF